MGLREVEAVIPELVYTDSNGYKSLSYDKVVPVLVEAIKEQQQLANEQKRIITEQQTAIANMNERLAKLDKLEAKLNRLEHENMTAQK